MKTLTADEYAELQRRGITCAFCYTYQKKWNSLQGCEFWNEGDKTETWGEAAARAKTRAICRRFASSTGWSLARLAAWGQGN